MRNAPIVEEFVVEIFKTKQSIGRASFVFIACRSFLVNRFHFFDYCISKLFGTKYEFQIGSFFDLWTKE